MGQLINVKATVLEDVVVFESDRSISGQDGLSFGSLEAASTSVTFPARLATRLFESDPAIDHVFGGSNGIVVRRTGGWPSDVLESVTTVVERFFVFY